MQLIDLIFELIFWEVESIKPKFIGVKKSNGKISEDRRDVIIKRHKKTGDRKAFVKLFWFFRFQIDIKYIDEIN